MALTLVSIEDGYTVHEDEDGEEILIAATPPFRRIVVPWEDFDLSAAWQDAVNAHREIERWGNPDRDTFIEDIRLGVADPDSVDVVWCESCDEPISEASAVSVNGGSGHACESCYEDNYYSCGDCGDTIHSDDSHYTLHDESVCERCMESNYAFCEDCDGYYHSSYRSEHKHGGCECESPAQTFTMRNDGDPVLNQDERVTIALPSGVISPEGIESIGRLLRSHGYNVEDHEERGKWWTLASEIESALGEQWQTREGNYTKRLSKLAYKSHALKIPPALLSQVGCVARDNSTGVDFSIEVTRDLNLPAEEFYHQDSCWWQSYAESRCALKSNGGIGMRTFSGPYSEVQGRAWIMPLRQDADGTLRPTFDSLAPDAFMIFNGYGDLSGYVPARIVAHMAGMTYRKVGFTCSPMYVNNSSGYLVASEEIAARYNTGGNISLYVDTHSDLHRTETRSLTHAA